ncbi:hypothetical protein HII13_003480 [Brettanomyces bruxellensis]|nr:hypothetical protein HII13_003480 [Brettanomyces bruxellensis]
MKNEDASSNGNLKNASIQKDSKETRKRSRSSSGVSSRSHSLGSLLKMAEKTAKEGVSTFRESEKGDKEQQSSLSTPRSRKELSPKISPRSEEDTVTKIDTQSTPRRILWVFWSSAKQNVSGRKENMGEGTSSGKGSQELKESLLDRKNATVTSKALNSDSLGFENETPKRRSSSWSFWGQRQEKYAFTFEPNVIVQSTAKPNSSPEASRQVIDDENEDGKGKNDKNGKQKKRKRPNIIVPSFRETIQPKSALTSISNGIKRVKVMLGYPKEQQLHLYRRLYPMQFKRILIIGIHGFFPTKVLRPILGAPTGTSTRFAHVAEKAVLEWAKKNGMNVKIQKIALQKEGKVFDRVNFFFDIMKKYEEQIKQADFIFVCAHSQGTPVGIILMSKLLEHGIIGDDQKIGILGMAGINNGPFHGMEQSLFVRAYSTFENESMLELFRFQNFESPQSRKYLESVRNLVRHNVRITYVGSIDDQLVPLYSSIASHVKHPNIFKAVYIDGGSDTPDFVSRIVKLSCMLQNLGYSDHDVIKEISYALAGPLTGGGHSRIYNDLNVYKLALDFSLDTEDSALVVQQPVTFKPFDMKRLGSNPFNLPWCVRGLFFEAIKRLRHGNHEIEMVFREFDDWNPDSKVLKDVKYRLNGIKAKL